MMEMDSELNYLDYKKMIKAKRNRECNWDRTEKRNLIRLVNQYRSIVDNRGNDSVWLRKKTAAWDAIHRGMIASGSRRGLKSIKQQWSRMKIDYKKKGRSMKKEIMSTDPEPLHNDAPEAKDSDADTVPVDCIIKAEYEPEEIIIDEVAAPVENQAGHTNIDSLNYDPTDSPSMASNASINGAATEPSLSAPLPAKEFVKRLRELPPIKPLLHRDIMQARTNQIELETAQRAETHALNLAHKKELHSLEVEQKKELHALQVLQLREQIEQQHVLFQEERSKLKASD